MTSTRMAGRRFRLPACRFGCCVADRRTDPVRRTRRAAAAATADAGLRLVR